jgi:small subunit ribosomal protein S8
MTDPIADMLTVIRNGLMAKKEEILIPFSRIKFEMAKILEKEGWVSKVEKTEESFDKIKIGLKYNEEGDPFIKDVKRISKPGRRIYVPWKKIPIVLNNFGMAIISTSQGIMTGQEAKKRKLGGELICEIF